MVSTRLESRAFAGEFANESCCRATDVGGQQATKDGGSGGPYLEIGTESGLFSACVV